MPQPKPIPSEHDEWRHMALALEGIAGALHAGHPVDALDLQHAARAADEVWQAGPQPDAGQDRWFADSRSHFTGAAAGCAQGDPKQSATVERSALEMARHLRSMSQHLAGHEPRGHLPAPATSDIATLASRYGRYGIRPMAA